MVRFQYEKLTGDILGLSLNEYIVPNKKPTIDTAKNQNLNQCLWMNDKTGVNLSSEQLVTTGKTETQLSASYSCQNEGLLGGSNDNIQKSYEEDKDTTISFNPENTSGSSKATEETALLISGESSQSQAPSFHQNLNICLDPLELQHFALQIARGMVRNIFRSRHSSTRTISDDKIKRLITGRWQSSPPKRDPHLTMISKHTQEVHQRPEC